MEVHNDPSHASATKFCCNGGPVGTTLDSTFSGLQAGECEHRLTAENTWGLPPPSPLPTYQLQKVGMRAPMQGKDCSAELQGLNKISVLTPTSTVENNELYAQIEETIRNTVGVGVRLAMRPVFRSLCCKYRCGTSLSDKLKNVEIR